MFARFGRADTCAREKRAARTGGARRRPAQEAERHRRKHKRLGAILGAGKPVLDGARAGAARRCRAHVRAKKCGASKLVRFVRFVRV